MSDELPSALWRMIGTRTCTCCHWFQVAIWLIDTQLPNTKPTALALCPRCDKLTPSTK